MQETGYDASTIADPAVARRIIADGLRRAAIEVHPFPRGSHSVVPTGGADLILVDLGPAHPVADLLSALRADAPRAEDAMPPEGE